MPFIDFFLKPSPEEPELTKEILEITLKTTGVAPLLMLYGDKRKWNKKHLKALTLILCNVVKHGDRDRGVFLYERKKQKNIPISFNPNGVGFSSIHWVIDELHKADLIDDVIAPKQQRGIMSQFTIKPRILKLAWDLGFTRQDTYTGKDTHVRLRDKDGKKRLEFKPNSYTKYIEELMSRYCEHLNKTYIGWNTINIENDEFVYENATVTELGDRYELEKIHLYRSFRQYTDDKDLLPDINNLNSKMSNPNFNFYGRAGGYYMDSHRALKEDRKTIHINGKETATADFPCSHINLCYRHETGEWLQKETYAELKEQGRELEDGYLVSPTVDRDVIKLLVMLMFNIKSKSAVSRKFNEELEKEKNVDIKFKRMETDYENKQLIDLVLLKHQPIKDYFLKGKLAGGIIQFEEANLMFNIADQFIREHKITTLTVHDELIVEKEHHAMVKEFMYSSGYNEICSKYSLMHKIKHM